MCPNPPVRDHTLGKAGITEVPGLLSAFSAVLGRDEMPPLLSSPLLSRMVLLAVFAAF